MRFPFMSMMAEPEPKMGAKELFPIQTRQSVWPVRDEGALVREHVIRGAGIRDN